MEHLVNVTEVRIAANLDFFLGQKKHCGYILGCLDSIFTVSTLSQLDETLAGKENQTKIIGS